MKSSESSGRTRTRRGYTEFRPWFCVQCGDIFESDDLAPTIDNLCPPCRRIVNEHRSKDRYMIKRRNGYKPRCHKVRGRKAYYTRLANLYFTDREQYDRLIENLREKHPGRVAQVTRRINARKQEIESGVC